MAETDLTPSNTDIPPYYELGGAPEEALSPVVVSVPHSGRYYPQSFLDASILTKADLRQSEDAFVDTFVMGLERAGATSLIASHARAYLDLNRDARELDQTMFSASLKHMFKPDMKLLQTNRVRAGLGCIPRIAGPGLTIYPEKLSPEVAQDRLQKLYHPFHDRLAAHLAARRKKFGCAILLDCHSMPAPASQTRQMPVKKQTSSKNPPLWPAIVLGDSWGTSCAPELMKEADLLFQGQNFSTRRNVPYAGGYNCKHYGAPDKGIHALQIEINRSLYMDEATLIPADGFNDTAARVHRTLVQICHFAAGYFTQTSVEIPAPRRAAE